MNKPKVTFIPLRCLPHHPTESVLISIGEPSEPESEVIQSFPDRLRLTFDDVEQEIPGYVMFDYLMALKILRFLDTHVSKDILIHCQAGISRSAALAKFMIDKMGYELTPDARSANNYSAFNRWVYRQLEITHLDHSQKKNR